MVFLAIRLLFSEMEDIVFFYIFALSNLAIGTKYRTFHLVLLLKSPNFFLLDITLTKHSIDVCSHSVGTYRNYHDTSITSPSSDATKYSSISLIDFSTNSTLNFSDSFGNGSLTFLK